MFPATSLPQDILDFRLPIFDWSVPPPQGSCTVLRTDGTDPISNRQSEIENDLGPPIGLEPTPNSFEANRSSVKLRGRKEFRISDFGFRI